MSVPTEPQAPAPPPVPPPAAPPAPPPSPEPAPRPSGGRAGRLLLALLGALLLAAAAAAAAWLAVEWRLASQVTAAMAEVEALRAQLSEQESQFRQQTDELTRGYQAAQQQMEARVAAVEQAAREAALVVQGAEGAQGLAQRLAEIGELRDALARQQEQTAAQLQALEESLQAQIGQQGSQTAEALAADLRLRSLLMRLHGHVLKTRVDLSEGNRGLAREELALAAESLAEALSAAPAERKPQIEELATLLERARTDMILEKPTARDQLDLLWHQASALLAQP